jgi:superoxide dismutase, Fe-Mn family
MFSLIPGFYSIKFLINKPLFMHQSSSRRNFIGNAAKAGIGTAFALPALGSLFSFRTPPKAAIFSTPIKTGFDQTPLAFAYNALEPNIDAETMDLHYNKHAAAYSKNLKEAAKAENVDANASLEDVLATISKYSVKMRNNGGGHYNHELFWKLLSPTPTQPSAKLLDAIAKDFGSLDNLKAKFTEAGKTRFGSGWAWLIITSDQKLVVTSSPNQDNPLMDIADVKGFPLFALDVWEHSYYLKYRNRRPDYIDIFWNVLNWDYVEARLDSLA